MFMIVPHANRMQYRESFRSCCQENHVFLQTVEAAAFIVCLDEASPDTPVKRAYQYFPVNAENRWFDKSLQFVICDNGASATICEHSMLDGTSILAMREFLDNALSSQRFGLVQDAENDVTESDLEFAELSFSSTVQLDHRINEVKQRLSLELIKYSFSAFDVGNVGNNFFRAKKCPSRSAILLAIQLACSRFFGYFPSTAETVSLAHFNSGRSVCSPTLWPEIVEFCNAMQNAATSDGSRRTLLFEAANTLVKSLSQSIKGFPVTYHLRALQWIARGDEPVPELFSNPIFTKLLYAPVVIDSLDHDLTECGGGLLKTPPSLFIHFQIIQER